MNERDLAELVRKLSANGVNGVWIPDNEAKAELFVAAIDAGYIRYRGSFSAIFSDSTPWLATPEGIAFADGVLGPAAVEVPVGDQPSEAQVVDDPAPDPAPVDPPVTAATGEPAVEDLTGETADGGHGIEEPPAPPLAPELASDAAGDEGGGEGAGADTAAPVGTPGLDDMVRVFLAHDCGTDELRAGAQRLAVAARMDRAELFTGRKPLTFTKRNARRWAKAMDKYSLAGVDEDTQPVVV